MYIIKNVYKIRNKAKNESPIRTEEEVLLVGNTINMNFRNGQQKIRRVHTLYNSTSLPQCSMRDDTCVLHLVYIKFICYMYYVVFFSSCFTWRNFYSIKHKSLFIHRIEKHGQARSRARSRSGGIPGQTFYFI